MILILSCMAAVTGKELDKLTTEQRSIVLKAVEDKKDKKELKRCLSEMDPENVCSFLDGLTLSRRKVFLEKKLGVDNIFNYIKGMPHNKMKLYLTGLSHRKRKAVQEKIKEHIGDYIEYFSDLDTQQSTSELGTARVGNFYDISRHLSKLSAEQIADVLDRKYNNTTSALVEFSEEMERIDIKRRSLCLGMLKNKKLAVGYLKESSLEYLVKYLSKMDVEYCYQYLIDDFKYDRTNILSRMSSKKRKKIYELLAAEHSIEASTTAIDIAESAE